MLTWTLYVISGLQGHSVLRHSWKAPSTSMYKVYLSSGVTHPEFIVSIAVLSILCCSHPPPFYFQVNAQCIGYIGSL